MFKAIVNANVVTEFDIIYDGVIVINDNRIVDVLRDKKDGSSETQCASTRRTSTY